MPAAQCPPVWAHVGGPPRHQNFTHPTAAAQGVSMETGASGAAQHLAFTGGWRVFGQRPLINCAAPQTPPSSPREAVTAPSLTEFKQHLGSALTHGLCFGWSFGAPGWMDGWVGDPCGCSWAILFLCDCHTQHGRAGCQPPEEARWPPPAPPPPRLQPAPGLRLLLTFGRAAEGRALLGRAEPSRAGPNRAEPGRGGQG